MPEYDLLAENRFRLKLTLSGNVADAMIDCPSHSIVIAKSTRDTIVTLAAGEACRDRDFILNLRLRQTEKDFVVVDADLDGSFVALASFVPRLPLPNEIPPKSFKILVDCSGSMGGDSIAQARQAISDILNRLRPEDFFNILAFGSTYKILFARQVQANKENITKVRRMLRGLDANMGGTEMKQALQAAVELSGPAIPQDILLITDGAVWENNEIIHMIKKSGHRVFTVGVGSSVSEAFLRQLACATGGAYELVVPNEEMTEKIVRHFNRIYLPRAENVSICWPVDPVKIITRDTGPVYDGDTLHVFACFSEKPSGPVTLDMSMEDGRTFSQIAVLDDRRYLIPCDCLASPLARMAFSQYLVDEDEKEARDLAVRYQLITPFTNYLVVEVRAADEKGTELPILCKIPHVLAAGWGGTGTVVRESGIDYDQRKTSKPYVICCFDEELFDEPTFVRIATPLAFVYKFNRLNANKHSPVLRIESFNDLLDCELPDRILVALKSFGEQYDPKTPEELIVLAFLNALTQSAIGGKFSRDSILAIKKAMKTLRPDERLTKLATRTFASISQNDWGQPYPLDNNNDEQEADADHDKQQHIA